MLPIKWPNTLNQSITSEDASNKVAKHPESINNFRRSTVANKARDISSGHLKKEANPWDDNELK